MQRMSKVALSLVGVAMLAGCAGGAQRAINELQATPATGDTFTQTLAREYLALAEKEYGLVNYSSSEYFANKGIQAAKGTAVPLTQPGEQRPIGTEFSAEAAELRAQTVDYVDRNRGADPVNAATAQTLYDCTVEEMAEPWQVEAQPRWINGCRDALVAMLAEGMPATIVLSSDILFDFDRYNIKPEFAPVLTEVAALITSNNEQVQVEGHTDSIGTPEYNMALGQRRADSVAGFLAGEGVPAGDMTAVSFGETRPIAPNDTPEGRALNRRVEIKR